MNSALLKGMKVQENENFLMRGFSNGITSCPLVTVNLTPDLVKGPVKVTVVFDLFEKGNLIIENNLLAGEKVKISSHLIRSQCRG